MYLSITSLVGYFSNSKYLCEKYKLKRKFLHCGIKFLQNRYLYENEQVCKCKYVQPVKQKRKQFHLAHHLIIGQRYDWHYSLWICVFFITYKYYIPIVHIHFKRNNNYKIFEEQYVILIPYINFRDNFSHWNQILGHSVSLGSMHIRSFELRMLN